MEENSENREVVLHLQPDDEFLTELERICEGIDATNAILVELLENLRHLGSAEALKTDFKKLE